MKNIMFNFLKKLKCQHSYKYIVIKKNTNENDSKYHFDEDFSQGLWNVSCKRYIFTFVVHKVCVKCHKMEQIAEFFGKGQPREEAENLAKKMNELNFPS